MASTNKLRRVNHTPEELKKVAETLAAAFKDDVVMNALMEPIKDPQTRLHFRNEKWFPALVHASSLNSAEIYEANDFEGVSIWLPSHANINSLGTILRTGLWRLIPTVGWKGYRRVTVMGEATNKVKARAGVKGTRYWYCFFVGVRDEHQGKGLSSLLMSPHVAHKSGPLAPSHNNLPCWLESTSVKSRTIYEHLGFELVETQIVAAGEVNEQGETDTRGEGVKLYCMHRKA
ncbi:hypothetical protein ACM66B_005900 [Microbotryomycetes sp. NB124-2]